MLLHRKRILRLLLGAAAASLLALTLLSALKSRSDGGDATAPQQQAGPAEQQPISRLDQLPAKCRGSVPCISFGSPYFSDWSGWMWAVRQWQDSAQAGCGSACDVVSDPSQADALLFHGRDLASIPTGLRRSSRQHWVYMNMESQMSTKLYGYDVSSNPKFRFMFNWTATTMLSSTVHMPYGLWDRQEKPVEGPFYSPDKKRLMAYVAFSNCKNSFNNRTAKVAALRRYIDVDVYGECGDKQLPKEWNVWRQISEKYRFYLSFENALCRDYITEKYHNNGLDSQAVPVVFGGLSRTDYEQVSPPGSFVYALDFPSMRDLAEHLKHLAADEDRYAGFFQWKRHYHVSPRTALLCGVCTRLHKDRSPGVADLSDYYDLQKNCRPSNYQYLP